jgi:hypothetical protein
MAMTELTLQKVRVYSKTWKTGLNSMKYKSLYTFQELCHHQNPEQIYIKKSNPNP